MPNDQGISVACLLGGEETRHALRTSHAFVCFGCRLLPRRRAGVVTKAPTLCSACRESREILTLPKRNQVSRNSYFDDQLVFVFNSGVCSVPGEILTFALVPVCVAASRRTGADRAVHRCRGGHFRPAQRLPVPVQRGRGAGHRLLERAHGRRECRRAIWAAAAVGCWLLLLTQCARSHTCKHVFVGSIETAVKTPVPAFRRQR